HIRLIKKAIAIAVPFELKPYRKSVYRSAAQMRDGGSRSVDNRVTGRPQSVTEVHLFVMIEKLLIKPPEAFEQITAKHHTTTGLPVHRPFTISCPSGIRVGSKEIRDVRQGPDVQSSNQVAHERWKRAS